MICGHDNQATEKGFEDDDCYQACDHEPSAADLINKVPRTDVAGHG
jgi:hypothetical protein